MDRDGSGSISGSELANVAIGGIRLGIEIAIKLIRIFDTDGNGEIGTKNRVAFTPDFSKI